MNIQIFWENDKSKELLEKVNISLEELWLLDFIKVNTTTSKKLQEELWIKKEPALILEEKSIDFKDVIFEWIIPEKEELSSMFISVIWWEWADGCTPDMCSSWCNHC